MWIARYVSADTPKSTPQKSGKPDDKFVDILLKAICFDHITDPDENINVADESKYKDIIDQLRIILYKNHF